MNRDLAPLTSDSISSTAHAKLGEAMCADWSSLLAIAATLLVLESFCNGEERRSGAAVSEEQNREDRERNMHAERGEYNAPRLRRLLR